ncbi:interleukin-17F-like [Emydura macquarii macquarii]|uniref:interleukin-17F-like n=1 Tax=Emydura macquarii macquarii TaxID=1129001 RepID=UPI00352B3488
MAWDLGVGWKNAAFVLFKSCHVARCSSVLAAVTVLIVSGKASYSRLRQQQLELPVLAWIQGLRPALAGQTEPSPSSLEFSSLLLMLILVLLAKNSAHGKAVQTGFNTESSADEKKSDDCPTEKDSKFPLSMKVDISISSIKQATKVAHDVSDRSMSPWDYSINEDPNRFPQVIAQANCRHYSCVDSTGREDYSMNSIPIQHEILALRREQRGCQHVYRLEKQLVTVGCTCVRPIIH